MCSIFFIVNGKPQGRGWMEKNIYLCTFFKCIKLSVVYCLEIKSFLKSKSQLNKRTQQFVFLFCIKYFWTNLYAVLYISNGFLI